MTIADDLEDDTVGGLPVDVASGAVPLVGATRGQLVESVHYGHVCVVAADGSVTASAGNPGVTLYPRSTVKLLQTTAMLRLGLQATSEQVALVCASHSAEPVHVAGVTGLLESVGLTLADLETTPSMPLGKAAREEWIRQGRGPESVGHDCSGKHAGMLATCVANGWPTKGYLAPDHPVQEALAVELADLCPPGEVTSVDGCGAPLMSCTLHDLAVATSRIATADSGTAEGRVAAAMRAHPELVAGHGRIATDVMTRVPGLIAKDGAEAVLVLALPDGAAAAIKILDGNGRAIPAAAAAVGQFWGWPVEDLSEVLAVPQLGHGQPVGVLGPVAGALVPADAAGDGARGLARKPGGGSGPAGSTGAVRGEGG